MDGQLVDLTYHEMELLRLLFGQPGRIISYGELAEALWSNSTTLRSAISTCWCTGCA